MNKGIIFCGCGYGVASHPYKDLEGLRVHELGVGSCCRNIATGSFIPTNFRIIDGVEVCDVNGYTITKYTLTNQRSYNKHEEGVWSVPKIEESIISIGEEW